MSGTVSTLQAALSAITGRVHDIDPAVAVPRLRAAQQALEGGEHGHTLAAYLGRVAELLERGQLVEAAASIPEIGTETLVYRLRLPEAQRPPLEALAEQLHLADVGPV